MLLSSVKTAASAIVDLIVCDIRDRQGLQNEWDSIDHSTRQDIRAHWAELASKTMIQVLDAEPPRESARGHQDGVIRDLESARHRLARAKRLGKATNADLSVLCTIEQLVDVLEVQEEPDRSDFYQRLDKLTAQMVDLYDTILRSKSPKGKTMAEIEAEILRDLPEEGCVEVGLLVGRYSTDPSGYGASNARAVLLALQERGEVVIHDDGHVSRKRA